MSLKLQFILVLNLLFAGGVVSIEVMSKYSSKTVYSNSIFLDISGFDIEETIYISVSTDYPCYYNNLHYKFYINTQDYRSSDSLSSVSYSSSVSTSNEETYNYRIEKESGGYNYLYMKSDCTPPLVFENTEDDNTTVIIIIVVVVFAVFIAALITIIVCCCRRCRRASVYGTVPYPVAPITPVYGVTPYVSQPVVAVGGVQPIQPIVNVQPYGVNGPYNQNQNINQNYNPNIINQDTPYNSAAPGVAGSETRINQGIRNEKPH